MRPSLLYFVVTALCAAAAFASLLLSRINAITILGLLLAALALWLGLSHRNAGN